MSTILVTGGTGLLGRSLVPALAGHRFRVVTVSRSTLADVTADLTDRSAALQVVAQVRPEVIVNLVAVTDVDGCERQPQSAYLGNVRVVENLAAAIVDQYPAPYLVQISTDQVYNGPGPHTETGVTLCNYYGFSKYAGELVAARVPSTVLRTNFVGRSLVPGGTSLTDWLVTAMRQTTPITVFEDVRFSPLRLNTVCEMIARVCERRTPGVFNLGSRDGMSKADFAFALAGALGLSTACLTRGLAATATLVAKRPTDMRLDSVKFEQEFGVVLPKLSDEIANLAPEYSDETR